MSFNDIPNEILVQIFSTLDFQAAVQCSVVCKRFHETLSKRLTEYYIDIWKATAAPPAGVRECDPLISAHSIIAIHDDTIDRFDFHPFSRNLHRTASANHKYLKSILILAALPGDRTLAGCWLDDRKWLEIFDLDKNCVLFKCRTRVEIFEVACTADTLALSDDDSRIQLYSWNGMVAEPLREIQNTRLPALSDTGLLAYQPAAASVDRDICFVRVHSSDEKRTIETGPITTRFGLSRDGHLLATEEYEEDRKFVVVYELDGRQIVARLNVKVDFYLPNGFFSVDSRFLLLCGQQTITVVDLHAKKSIDFPVKFYPLGYFAGFRTICGELYVQALCCSRNLDFKKIDITSNSWELID